MLISLTSHNNAVTFLRLTYHDKIKQEPKGDTIHPLKRLFNPIVRTMSGCILHYAALPCAKYKAKNML